MIINLPWPPTLNTMYATVGKRRVLSKRGREYRESVYAEVLNQHGIFKPFTSQIKVSVELIQPDRRKRDIDNLFKALFDALGYANCYMDDSQISELWAIKREPDGTGRCIVVIEEL